MNQEAFLEEHIRICDDIYRFLLNENAIIRDPSGVLSDSFLEEKKMLLEKLEDSVLQLSQLKRQAFSENDKVKVLIKKAEKKLTKILLMGKDNEILFEEKRPSWNRL